MISMNIAETATTTPSENVKYSVEKLKQLKKIIDNKSSEHHEKILEIIVKHDINFSENNNGIFLSLNKLPNHVVDEIEKYLKYIDEQEKILSTIETAQEGFEKEYFNKTT